MSFKVIDNKERKDISLLLIRRLNKFLEYDLKEFSEIIEEAKEAYPAYNDMDSKEFIDSFEPYIKSIHNLFGVYIFHLNDYLNGKELKKIDSLVINEEYTILTDKN